MSIKEQNNKFDSIFAYTLIIFYLCIHIYIVYTIAVQPLNVNNYPPQYRSAVWYLYNDTIHRLGPGADFFAVYHSGYALRQKISIYKLDENPRITPYFYSFRYLPIVAQTLGYFFIQFPPRLSYLIWIFILEIFLGLLIFMFAFTIKNWLFRCFIICILLLNTPYFLELHMGQFTFITSALLCISLLLNEDKGKIKKIIGNISYIIAVLIKIFPIITIFAFIRKKNYRFSIIITLIVLLITSIFYFILNPDDWKLFYSRNLLDTGGMDLGNYSLLYLLYIIGEDFKINFLQKYWSVLTISFRVILLALTALIVCFSKYSNLVVGSIAMVMAYFLSYNCVWEHHISGIIIMGILFFKVVISENTFHKYRLILILSIISLVLLALPTPYIFFDYAKNSNVFDPSFEWQEYKRYILVLCKVIPMIILYLVCIYYKRA